MIILSFFFVAFRFQQPSRHNSRAASINSRESIIGISHEGQTRLKRRANSLELRARERETELLPLLMEQKGEGPYNSQGDGRRPPAI